MPDFLLYHRSLTDELHSLKNRLRNIVDDHNWQADGEYKESALRSVIRRHLPESMLVGRGFIVTEHTTSSQIDILIVDRNAPTLFKDGDLMIVTPDAVKAAIEVKTSLRPMQEIQEAVLKLAEIGRMSQRAASQNPIWTGIFVYDDGTDMDERQGNLLAAFQSAFEQTGYKVNCMAYGKHTLIRYWTADEVEYGRVPQELEGELWRSYYVDGFAPSYLIGNLLESIAGVGRESSSYAWFPIVGGKYAFRTWLLPIGTRQPIEARPERT